MAARTNVALRLLEAFLPRDAESRLEEVLEGKQVISRWSYPISDTQILLKVVLEAADTEGVLGALSDRWGHSEGFRLVLLPVEALLPRPEKPKEEEKPPEAEPPPKNARRIAVEEVYHEVGDMLGTGKLFFTLVVLSTVVAAVGLYRDSVAVIIGAMVIAPLLGPSVALSLATTLGDLKLAARAGRGALLGSAVVLLMALLFGYVFPIDSALQEVASRTEVDVVDVILALASGAAGALSLTTGVSSALVGVMVAVAVLPPLVVAGLLFGNGEPGLGLRAFTLFGVNVICINLAGVLTFMAKGIRPRNYWDVSRARRATLFAVGMWGLFLAALVLLVQFALR